MTTPTLAPLPRDTARRDPFPTRAPLSPSRAPRARPGISYERVLGWSLLLSVLLHAVLLLLTGDFIRVEPMEQLAGRASRPAEPFAGIEWVLPVPEGAEGNSPAARSAEAVPLTGAPRVVRMQRGEATVEAAREIPAAEEVTGVPGGRVDARERLRPGYRDPRLYVDADPLVPSGQGKTAHQEYMEHLQARIDAVNDSMGTVAARERAAKDWTFRDKEGKRWGISEEGLHLGGFTVPRGVLPVPAATGDNQSREAAREEQRQRDEIRRQEEERERRRKQEAAIGETRERKAGEKKPGGGGLP